MKKLFLLLALIPVLGFSSGKLSLTPGYYFDKKEILPTAGISIYEPVFLGLTYDSFTGYGVAPRMNAADVRWFATRQDLKTDITDDLSLSLGATMRLIMQDGFDMQNENNIHCSLEYRLW